MLQWRYAVMGVLFGLGGNVCSAEACSNIVEMMEFEVVIHGASSRVLADSLAGFEVTVTGSLPYAVRVVPLLDDKQPLLYARYEYRGASGSMATPFLVGETLRPLQYAEAADLALPEDYRVVPLGVISVCADSALALMAGNCCLSGSSGQVCGCAVELGGQKCCRHPCCGATAV